MRTMICFTLGTLLALSASELHASSVASASKACMPAAPCTVTSGAASFTISTSQTVRWQATGTWAPPAGDDFWLTTSGALAPGVIEITSNLTSGPHAGSFLLAAGNYSIAIADARMGPGSYTIEYDLTASLAIAPPLSHAFPPRVAGSGPSSAHSFSIRVPVSSDLPVRVTSIVSGGDPHFELTSLPSLPALISPGAARTFDVRFNPLTTPGSFSTTITVSGTSDPPGAPVAPVTATVSGTTTPALPNIACSSGSCATASSLATVDGDIPGATTTFPVAFENNGAGALTVTSVEVVNDSAAPVFSLVSGGGAATLPPSGDRTVTVRFTPPPGEALYCGHLEIQSSDPDTPTKRCYFRATAHHPAPRMVIASTTLDYGEVELGFSYRRAVVVQNTGDAPLIISLTQVCETDPTCSGDLAQFSPDTLGGPFTIAGGGQRLIEQIYTPTAAATHTIRIRIDANDPTNPSRVVTLTGRGLAPVPIDGVLVLDRSYSMNDSAGPRRKIDALRTGADLFVHLLRGGADPVVSDGVGLVKYNHTNDTYLPLAPLTPSQLAAAEIALEPAAVSDIARLGPSGSTGIGGAMQRAASMLVPPSPTRKHVVVVLTDGQENVEPWARDVIGPMVAADPGVRIYSIGLGNEINADVLSQITNVTNGRFLATSDLTGVHRYELEAFYFKIFSNATGMSIVVDPTIPVSVSGTAPVEVGTARLVSSDRYVTFLLLDEPELRDLYTLELVDPAGHVIDLASTIAGVPVHILRRENYALYRVNLPSVADASLYTGDWIVQLTPTRKWQPNGNRWKPDGDFINALRGLVPIGFGVAVGSDYKMITAATSLSTLPGAEITLTASFTDRGAPSRGRSVFVNVTPPGAAAIAAIPLFDDGSHGDGEASDGIWTTRYTATSTPGVYQFLFRGLGENDRGELVQREDSRWVPLVQPSTQGGSNNGDDVGGDAPRRLWWSLHLGHSFPLGAFARSYDPGTGIILDAEWTLTPAWSAYLMLGEHYFHGRHSTDLEVTNLSLNLRRYFVNGVWPLFVELGPGAYRHGGTTTAGGNLGAGVLFPLRTGLGAELGTNVHAFEQDGIKFFVDVTLGLRFRF